MDLVVTYDIADDQVRLRLARLLEGYGSRVENSVFELFDMGDGITRSCLSELRRFDLGESDSIRIYRLCAQCKGKCEVLGSGSITENPDLFIV